jgi:hypothetical protein
LGAATAILDGQSNVCFSPQGHWLAIGESAVTIRLLDGSPLPQAKVDRLLADIRPGAVSDRGEPAVSPTGGLKIMGFATAAATRKPEAPEEAEQEVKLLYVVLSYPYYHFQPTEEEYERLLVEASQKVERLAPRNNMAKISISQFTLILPDGAALPPIHGHTWPEFQLFRTGKTFTTTHPIDPFKRDAFVLTWVIPEETVDGPFQVRLMKFEPVPVPPVRVPMKAPTAGRQSDTP